MQIKLTIMNNDLFLIKNLLNNRRQLNYNPEGKASQSSGIYYFKIISRFFKKVSCLMQKTLLFIESSRTQ